MELQNFLYGRCLVQCASNPSHQSESRRLKENSPKGLEDSLWLISFQQIKDKAWLAIGVELFMNKALARSRVCLFA